MISITFFIHAKHIFLFSKLILLFLSITELSAYAFNLCGNFLFCQLVCLFAAFHLHLVTFSCHLDPLGGFTQIHRAVSRCLKAGHLLLHFTYDFCPGITFQWRNTDCILIYSFTDTQCHFFLTDMVRIKKLSTLFTEKFTVRFFSVKISCQPVVAPATLKPEYPCIRNIRPSKQHTLYKSLDFSSCSFFLRVQYIHVRRKSNRLPVNTSKIFNFNLLDLHILFLSLVRTFVVKSA